MVLYYHFCIANSRTVQHFTLFHALKCLKHSPYLPYPCLCPFPRCPRTITPARFSEILQNSLHSGVHIGRKGAFHHNLQTCNQRKCCPTILHFLSDGYAEVHPPPYVFHAPSPFPLPHAGKDSRQHAPPPRMRFFSAFLYGIFHFFQRFINNRTDHKLSPSLKLPL